MSRAVKKVFLQVSASALFMLAVVAAIILTGTAGVDPKTFPPAYAENQTAVAGRSVFQKAGCASCHQIMRQGGNSRDLTYIGREYDKQTLARLIREPGDYLKGRTGDLMPSFSKKDLSDKDLKKLSEYLATLK